MEDLYSPNYRAAAYEAQGRRLLEMGFHLGEEWYRIADKIKRGSPAIIKRVGYQAYRGGL